MPEARKGRTAARFIAYAERALNQIGVGKEIDVSVKLVNKAARFFQIIGYRHTSNGLSKILEDSYMCAPTPPKPDPMIGQAAMSNAELAKEQAAVAREQLAWGERSGPIGKTRSLRKS